MHLKLTKYTLHLSCIILLALVYVYSSTLCRYSGTYNVHVRVFHTTMEYILRYVCAKQVEHKGLIVPFLSDVDFDDCCLVMERGGL